MQFWTKIGDFCNCSVIFLVALVMKMHRNPWNSILKEEKEAFGFSLPLQDHGSFMAFYEVGKSRGPPITRASLKDIVQENSARTRRRSHAFFVRMARIL